jgi:uncharacterized protein with HEPN domain
MNDEVRKNLIDILQAAEEINAFTRSMDFQSYRECAVTQRAVERNFEIVGEALNRIKKLDETILLAISGAHRIIGFRNILIHGYDTVDDAIVWGAVKDRLPVLMAEIKGLLSA